ncbi:MAG: shikimate dehydrogenase [Synechococcus sp. BS307-5m-G37]|nr:shikimate dehydrogenase [Synechococcus sp. BS307-5m-G37]
MISGTTGLIGLLGQPVRHSLSPAMHNAALEAMGLDWRYMALPCAESDLGSVLSGLRAVNCRGLNVTIPHKQAVASHCTELSALASRLQAVNTLIPADNGGWYGHNTDAEGFLAPLQDTSEAWQGGTAIVLGCGGSARAVVAGLQQLPLNAIHIAGRRDTALAAFLDDLHQPDEDKAVPLVGIPLEGNQIREVLAQACLVVNTTPVGMEGHQDGSAMPLDQDIWNDLRTSTTLYDLIYTPRPTPWLTLGAERGCRIIDGLEMLIQQGAASLRRWSGCTTVPVEVMRQAALNSLASTRR